MKIFLSSIKLETMLEYQHFFPNQKINILKSFAAKNSDIKSFLKNYRDKIGLVFLDSVYPWRYKLTQETVLEKFNGYLSYLRFIKKLPANNQYDGYFNFDINFDSNGFEDNLYYQKRLEKEGLNPIPVIHNLTGYEAEYYIDKGYKIVAIASNFTKKFKNLSDVVFKLYSSGIKIHLLGTANFNILSELPIYSCDTTGWNFGCFGLLYYWNPHKKDKDKTSIVKIEDFHRLNYKNQNFLNYQYKEELKEYLSNTFKINYEDLLKIKGYKFRRLLNMHYFLELETIINKIHLNKGFIIT